MTGSFINISKCSKLCSWKGLLRCKAQSSRGKLHVPGCVGHLGSSPLDCSGSSSSQRGGRTSFCSTNNALRQPASSLRPQLGGGACGQLWVLGKAHLGMREAARLDDKNRFYLYLHIKNGTVGFWGGRQGVMVELSNLTEAWHLFWRSRVSGETCSAGPPHRRVPTRDFSNFSRHFLSAGNAAPTTGCLGE